MSLSRLMQGRHASSARFMCDGEPTPYAHLGQLPFDLGVVGDLEVAELLQRLPDGDLQHHPSEGGASTLVRTCPERHVAVRLAIEDDLVRVREHARIAVGGAEEHRKAVALLEGTAFEFWVFDDRPPQGYDLPGGVQE